MVFDYLSFWEEETNQTESEKETAFKEEEKQTLKTISFSFTNEVLVLETLHGNPKNLNQRLFGIFRQNENKLLRELKRKK